MVSFFVCQPFNGHPDCQLPKAGIIWECIREVQYYYDKNYYPQTTSRGTIIAKRFAKKSKTY